MYVSFHPLTYGALPSVPELHADKIPPVLLHRLGPHKDNNSAVS
jgi:hypothetical protein